MASPAYDSDPAAGRDGAGSDAGSSVPSTLYARCTATASEALNARRLREAADHDVRFLQNRLAKLRLEEDRSKEEIAALRRKCGHLASSKARHEAAASQRRALRDQVDYGRRKEAAMIALNKERQAKAVWAAKQRVIQQKREAVLSMRKEKEINACRVEISREETREVAVRQRSSIRQLQDMARQRREHVEEQRREAAREAYAQRLRQEEEDRATKEQLAAELIQQEALMVHRLKRLHREKQTALHDLADTVAEARSGTPAGGGGAASPDFRASGGAASGGRGSLDGSRGAAGGSVGASPVPHDASAASEGHGGGVTLPPV